MQEIVEHDAQVVQICSKIMSFSIHKLRRDVAVCANKTVRHHCLFAKLLAQAEIDDLNVTSPVKHNVLWLLLPWVYLQVSVNDPLFVQVIKCTDNFCDIESGNLFGDFPVPLHKMEQISSRIKVHDEENIVVALERIKDLALAVNQGLPQIGFRAA